MSIRSLFGATVLCAAASAATAEMVVIESNVPTLAVGKVLAASDKVSIADKGRVVVLAPTGKMVTLQGPYSGAVPGGDAKPDGRLALALASLVQRKGEETGSVGAMRALGAEARIESLKNASDVLAIDPTAEGAVCVYEPGAKRLARNPLSPIEKLVIHDIDSGESATVVWPKDKETAAWPAALPLKHGKSFLFEQPGRANASQVTVQFVKPEAAASDVERAAQLAEAGCDTQAWLLLRLAGKNSR
jgi:hypothetical protein